MPKVRRLLVPRFQHPPRSLKKRSTRIIIRCTSGGISRLPDGSYHLHQPYRELLASRPWPVTECGFRVDEVRNLADCVCDPLSTVKHPLEELAYVIDGASDVAEDAP